MGPDIAIKAVAVGCLGILFLPGPLAFAALAVTFLAAIYLAIEMIRTSP